MGRLKVKRKLNRKFLVEFAAIIIYISVGASYISVESLKAVLANANMTFYELLPVVLFFTGIIGLFILLATESLYEAEPPSKQ
jgi:hypothetical protein